MLPPEAVHELGLSHPTHGGNTCVVVVSHDCDIANDDLNAEPCVEVIVGRLLTSIDGNLAWGKAPRKLHYTVDCEGKPAHIELSTGGKQLVHEENLAHFQPNDSFALDRKALATLRSWLGSRYNRASFPDTFVDRMRSTRADEKLAKALAQSGELISFVFFDVDGGKSIERSAGQPYELSIVLVFPPGNDPTESADAAEKLTEEVADAVGKRLSGGKDIVLQSCFAVSEDDIPVSKAKVLTQWRLEHMTLKATQDSPGPPQL